MDCDKPSWTSASNPQRGRKAACDSAVHLRQAWKRHQDGQGHQLEGTDMERKRCVLEVWAIDSGVKSKGLPMFAMWQSKVSNASYWKVYASKGPWQGWTGLVWTPWKLKATWVWPGMAMGICCLLSTSLTWLVYGIFATSLTTSMLRRVSIDCLNPTPWSVAKKSSVTLKGMSPHKETFYDVPPMNKTCNCSNGHAWVAVHHCYQPEYRKLYPKCYGYTMNNVSI